MKGKLAEKLESVFSKAQCLPKGNVKKLSGWRFFVQQSKYLSAGLKNNVCGSVYTPPSYKQSENGEIFLIWEDGKCSRAHVENLFDNSAENWEEQLNLWRMASFYDEYASHIPYPQEIPEVCIEDEKLYDIVANDNSPIFDQLGKLIDNNPQGAVMDGKINVIWGDNIIKTSTGIDQISSESGYSASWSFDSILGTGFASRRLITEKEWDSLWQESLEYYQVINKSGKLVNSSTKVIFAPSVAGQMIGQYILPNFKGENVLEGQSKFSRQAFLSNEKIFNSDLLIEVNPLLPERWASYRITSEGVPATKTILVQGGCLESPYLKVKDAFRWGQEPTALPIGSAGIRLCKNKEISWDKMINDTPDGILVHSVLGLHTQNPVTGDYSLSAPSSLRIINGKIVGKTDVKINGNFWNDLSSSETLIAYSKLHSQPYLKTETKVENL